MADPTSYRTIARGATTDIVVRRSRFRCTLRRVDSVAAARLVVAECRIAHPEARHHCSAMVIGARGDERHSGDDGEPSGTAGAPMLRALLDAGVSDVVAVVTRWFGGVLLGAGGLTRAYGDAVRAALDHAGRIVRVQRALVEVELPHADAGRIEAVLLGAGADLIHAEYTDRATLRFATGDADAMRSRLAGLTAGAARPRIVGSQWVDR